MGRPSVFPTGVTSYNPEKCFNGYTLFQAQNKGVMLINMNGKVVRFWKDLQGFPTKMLPGGIILGQRGERDRTVSYQDKIDLVKVDWDGNVLWEFNKNEFIEDPNMAPQWMARQHHDFQFEGNPTGYYSPEVQAEKKDGKMLLLLHKNAYNKRIAKQELIDDYIIEIDKDGNKVWEWMASKHFNEFGFDEMAKNSIYRNPNVQAGYEDGIGD